MRPAVLLGSVLTSHFNFYRDYDPSTGRYLEADPIGLFGGINLYAYAGLNPLRYIDPKGLDNWVEGPAIGEPPGHLSLCVGQPRPAPNQCFSFGVNGDPGFGGEVYEDTTRGGVPLPGYYRRSSAQDDAAATRWLQHKLGSKAPYRPWRTCRNFAFDNFEELGRVGYGTPAVPPQMPTPPGNPSSHVPLPLSSLATDGSGR